MSPSEGQPAVIGLVGGIAAGKTAVAQMFSRLGARAISADEIAHAVVNEPPTRARIIARWGEDVVDAIGKIDRTSLAERVFGDSQEVAALEAITHPAILAKMRQQIAAARASPDEVAIVVDAPLLLEAELDDLCDVLVFVDCPREVRLARVVGGRGWDSDELDRRESHQMPLEAKRQQANYVVDAALALETTFQQVQQLWQEALGL